MYRGGGSKPGERRGGRKKGSPNRDKRAILRAAKQRGLTPMSVMQSNMTFWHERAHKMASGLERIMKRQDLDVPMLIEIKEMVGQLLAYRRESQSCAEGLAKYVHPALQSITVGGDKKNPIAITVKGGLPQSGASGIF